MSEDSSFHPKTAGHNAVLDAGAANDALAAGPQACDGMAVPQPGAAAALRIFGMKAISLWQPWASLWLTDRKPNETRHWSTTYRGWLAVHATKHIETGEMWGAMNEILESQFGRNWRKNLPTGAIIGAVDLVSVTQMPEAKPAHADDFQCGNWEDGRFAWRRSAVVILKEPIPYRGRQSMFTLPDDIVAKILPSQSSERREHYP